MTIKEYERQRREQDREFYQLDREVDFNQAIENYVELLIDHGHNIYAPTERLSKERVALAFRLYKSGECTFKEAFIVMRVLREFEKYIQNIYYNLEEAAFYAESEPNNDDRETLEDVEYTWRDFLYVEIEHELTNAGIETGVIF